MNTVQTLSHERAAVAPTVNWRHVAAFLGLTFGLTRLLDLLIYLRGGLAQPGMATLLQLQMLLPAASAIVLGMFVFRDSPLHRSRPAGAGRWFYVYFLLLTAVFVIAAAATWLAPTNQALALIAATVPVGLSVLGPLLLGVLRLIAGREGMARVGLS